MRRVRKWSLRETQGPNMPILTTDRSKELFIYLFSFFA